MSDEDTVRDALERLRDHGLWTDAKSPEMAVSALAALDSLVARDKQATDALVRERLRMHEERQRAEAADARLRLSEEALRDARLFIGRSTTYANQDANELLLRIDAALAAPPGASELPEFGAGGGPGGTVPVPAVAQGHSCTCSGYARPGDRAVFDSSRCPVHSGRVDG